jgi:thiol-disulfide isomerase/thioredoxin
MEGGDLAKPKDNVKPQDNVKPAIITKISSVAEFSQLLQKNPGLIIMKYGAEWCGPCKKIESLVGEWFNHMPAQVQCCLIDIDQNIELYGFMKSKKRINGIPAIMCYVKGNTHYIPDDMVAGADPAQIAGFFQRSLKALSEL